MGLDRISFILKSKSKNITLKYQAQLGHVSLFYESSLLCENIHILSQTPIVYLRLSPFGKIFSVKLYVKNKSIFQSVFTTVLEHNELCDSPMYNSYFKP